MAAELNFDDLNTLGFDAFAESYYEVMEITPKQKRDRVRLSKKLNELMLFIFTLIEEQKSRNLIDRDFLLKQFRDDLTPIVIAEVRPRDKKQNAYVDKYINDMPDDVLYATMLGVGAYWLSKERAASIALNEANTIRNYGDLLDAMRKGFTRKQWLTMGDMKVRPTHEAVDSVIKPIDGYFEVGGELMLYPHDYVNCNNPAELVNCRCSLAYVR